MSPGDPVSQRELDDLRRTVEANAARLDAIDASGTRGVAVLAVQISELAKDFAKHEQLHEQAETRRLTSRRWVVAAAIALIGAIDGPLVTLIVQRGHF